MKYAMLFLLLSALLGLFLSGGPALSLQKSRFLSPPSSNNLYTIVPGVISDKLNLQLITLNGVASTPVPTPTTVQVTPTSGITPTPTTTQSCSTQKVAVDILLDTSGSMCLPGSVQPCVNPPVQSKIYALKHAVLSFVQRLHADDVIGIQEFSTNAGNLVTPDLVSVNTSQVNTKVQGIYGIGYTYTREGFAVAKQQIDSKRTTFPNHTWVLVFISDGVPETEGVRPNEIQNPLNPPSIVDAIKQSGVRIISIGLNLDIYTGPGFTYATNLMKNIASSPTDYYETPTATQLDQIYQSIAQQICR